MLKLFHREKLVGLISDVSRDDTFSMSGRIELTDAGNEYKQIFSFLTDEEKMNRGDEQELPFREEDLDGWSIEDESGERLTIMAPGVYDDGEICWRA